MLVSKFVTTELSFFSRTTNRHEHWVCWMPMGGKNSLMKHTHTEAWNM